MTETPVRFDAAGLLLEGRLARPAGTRSGAVVCHPHPRYGGTMDNNVVEALVRGLSDAGMATLRFNFRGVGSSEGETSDTLAERADATAAIGFLAGETGGRPVTLCGYSFGAIVSALTGPADPRVDRLVLVALPLTMFDPEALRGCSTPKLFIHGDRDAFCGAAAVQDFVSGLPGSSELRLVAGADHFFFGHEDDITREVAAFAARKE